MNLLHLKRQAARRMRQDMTPAEAKLWRHLSRITTIDTHFCRQVPIEPYVVDFACLRARLVIEVDGEHHGFDVERSRDAIRTRRLEAEGFRVLRFWNGEILHDIEAVLDAVHAALYGHASAEPRSFSRRRGDKGRRIDDLPRLDGNPPP